MLRCSSANKLWMVVLMARASSQSLHKTALKFCRPMTDEIAAAARHLLLETKPTPCQRRGIEITCGNLVDFQASVKDALERKRSGALVELLQAAVPEPQLCVAPLNADDLQRTAAIANLLKALKGAPVTEAKQ